MLEKAIEAITLFLKLDRTLLLPLFHNDILLLLFNCIVALPTNLLSSSLFLRLTDLVRLIISPHAQLHTITVTDSSAGSHVLRQCLQCLAFNPLLYQHLAAPHSASLHEALLATIKADNAFSVLTASISLSVLSSSSTHSQTYCHCLLQGQIPSSPAVEATLRQFLVAAPEDALPQAYQTLYSFLLQCLTQKYPLLMASSPRTDIVTHSSVFSVLTTHLLHKATPDGLLAAEMLAAPVGALVSSLLACVAKHPLPSTTASSTLTTTPDSISASTQENAVRLPSSLHAQLSLSMDAIALATLLLCTAQAAQRDAIAPLLPELLGRLHEALESVNGRVASTADSDVERGYRRLKRLLGSWLFGFDVRLLVDEDEAMSQRSPLRGMEVLPLYLMALRCGHCTASTAAFLALLQDALPAALFTQASSLSLLTATAQELLLLAHDAHTAEESTQMQALLILSSLLFQSMECDAFCSLLHSVCAFVLWSFPVQEAQRCIGTVFTALFKRLLTAPTFSFAVARNLAHLIRCTEEIGVTSQASFTRYRELVDRMKTQERDAPLPRSSDQPVSEGVSEAMLESIPESVPEGIPEGIPETMGTPTPLSEAAEQEELRHCFATLFPETLVEGVSVGQVLLPLVDRVCERQDNEAEKCVESLLLLLLRKLFATVCALTPSTEPLATSELQLLVYGLHKLLTLAQVGSASDFVTLALAALLVVSACCERLAARGLENSLAFLNGEKLFLSDCIETETTSTDKPLLFALPFVPAARVAEA